MRVQYFTSGLLWLSALVLILLLGLINAQDAARKVTPEPMATDKVAQFMAGSGHTNNWAVLVCILASLLGMECGVLYDKGGDWW